MLYAPTKPLIRTAAENGLNWAVVASEGHIRDSFPGGPPADDLCELFPDYPALYKNREPYREAIEARRRCVRERIDRAHQLGLKAALTSYEVSLPPELPQLHPEVMTPPVEVAVTGYAGFVENEPVFCLNREEARGVISARIAEFCRSYPEMDAFIYSNHESQFANYKHRCPYCANISYARQLKLLYDAVKQGMRQAGSTARLIVRLWGITEHREYHQRSAYDRMKAGIMPEDHYRRWIEVRDRFDIYDPDIVIPEFQDLMKNEDNAFMYKATWADISLRQPENKWIGTFSGHEQIMEISFEFCGYDHFVFLPLTGQIPHYADRARQEKLSGICGVPTSWGRPASAENTEDLDPACWRLNKLNIDLYAAAASGVLYDVKAFIKGWLFDRYGAELPAACTDYLLRCEDLDARAYLVDGINPADGCRNPCSMRYIKSSNLRYAYLQPDGLERMARLRSDPAPVFAEKQKAIEELNELCLALDALQDSMPQAAYDDFSRSFGNQRDFLKTVYYRQLAGFTLWGWEESGRKLGHRESAVIDGWRKEIERLMAESSTARALALAVQDPAWLLIAEKRWAEEGRS